MVALLVPWSCNKAQLKGFIRLPLIKKKKKSYAVPPAEIPPFPQPLKLRFVVF